MRRRANRLVTPRRLRLVAVVGVGLVALASCAEALPSASGDIELAATASPIDLANPNGTYDPVQAGEVTPPGYRQLLRRDDIAPVYRPDFLTAEDAPWSEDLLVIGVEIDGEARAYPVGFLTRREIVNDWHKGIPTLVTW